MVEARMNPSRKRENKRRDKRVASCAENDVTIQTADSSGKCDVEEPSTDSELTNRIFVGNISYRVDWRQLKKFFSKFGEVVHVHIVTDHVNKNWSKGIGFVSFSDSEAVKKALEADENDLYLDYRLMRVSKAEQSRKAGFGAVMAAEREQKLRNLRSQHTHNDHTIKKVDHVTTTINVTHSPKFPKKQSATGKQTPEDVGAIVKENQKAMPHKRVKQKGKSRKKSSTQISQLNVDELLEIFSYLSVKDCIRLERVCKHWRDVLHKLWLSTKHLIFDKSFSIFRSRQGLTDKVLESVVAKGSGELLSLDLSAVPHLLTDHALSVIGVYCPKLTKLDLSGVAITLKSMNALTLKCEHLKWLRLQRCHSVTEKCLWWIFNQCKQLEHIDVAGNRSITGQCFVIAPKTIKSLALSDCQQLSAAGVSKLAKHCLCLEVLVITKCFNVDDQAIQDVLQHCIKLKELHFSVQNTAVKSTGFSSNFLKDLTVLVVSGHRMFNDDALIAVGKTCTQLRKLQCATCYNVSDVGLSSLASCIMLTYLDISYCSNVTDKGFSQLINVCNLHHLLLRACQGITDTGVCYLASHSSSLVELDLSGCMSVTNKSLEALQENLLFARENKTHFNLLIGGTLIDAELGRQFAVATGSSVCQHDLSIPSLAADYDPFLDMPPLTEESWEARNKHNTSIAAAGDENYDYYLPDEDTITTEQAMELLTADDPAYYSDDFSNPDDYCYDDEGSDELSDDDY